VRLGEWPVATTSLTNSLIQSFIDHSFIQFQPVMGRQRLACPHRQINPSNHLHKRPVVHKMKP